MILFHLTQKNTSALTGTFKIKEWAEIFPPGVENIHAFVRNVL